MKHFKDWKELIRVTFHPFFCNPETGHKDDAAFDVITIKDIIQHVNLSNECERLVSLNPETFDDNLQKCINDLAQQIIEIRSRK